MIANQPSTLGQERDASQRTGENISQFVALRKNTVVDGGNYHKIIGNLISEMLYVNFCNGQEAIRDMLKGLT